MREGERELHPALQQWDLEDNDQGGNPISQKSSQIGSILCLMRQLLISWAAVGHSAAASVEGVHARSCSVKLLTLRPIHGLPILQMKEIVIPCYWSLGEPWLQLQVCLML